ncbi:MAG: hypothetical protein NW201_01565 [Gemmatimonadales bacterium]|nr:hypothetical protein [Gemmatimonadales bacterium]
MLALLLPVALLAAQDTATYADAATRTVVEAAIARRRTADDAVRDYSARLRYRLSLALGRGKWSQPPVAAAEEQEARIQWARPNDLRIDVLGRRTAERLANLKLSSQFNHPWFVPRGVGDSMRIFAADFPAVGAVHPLSDGAAEYYRYALVDSVAVTAPGGRTVRAVAVEVVPRRAAPALIAGRLWIERTGHDVVRLTFRYVGTALFQLPEGERRRDTTAARSSNRIINRFLNVDCDLEYALEEGGVWLPLRQTIAGRVEVPFLGDLVIPFSAVTTFHDYAVNTGTPVAFTMAEPPVLDASLGAIRARRAARADSLRAEMRDDPDRQWGGSRRAWDRTERWADGRYELHRPSNDSLRAYTGWSDTLELARLDEDALRIRREQARLAALAERLPGALTGRPRFGLDLEQSSDLFSFNRVQGLSSALGARLRVAPFTDVYATARYGLSDERFTGRLTVLHDGPALTLGLTGYHEILDQDPVSRGRSFANSLNAVFAARDYADYYLGEGVQLRARKAVGTGLDLDGAVRWERQRSVLAVARSGVNDFLGGDGVFVPGNAAVAEGNFAGAALGLVGSGRLPWRLTADALGGDPRSAVRLWGELRPAVGEYAGATLRLRAGVGSAAAPLPQFAFRAGGQQSVRGYDYGVQRGQAFWSAQLDVAPFDWPIRPVAFLDAGRAARAGDLASGTVLVGGGVGIGLYSTRLRASIIRFDVSRPVNATGSWRFDLVLQPPR